jgi:hypothetical protein
MVVVRRSEKVWKELIELVAAWEIYVANLHLSDNAFLRTTIRTYEPALHFYRKLITAGIAGPPWPKGLMAGLRQGSREAFFQIGQVFRSHPEISAALRQAGGESLKQLLDYPKQVEKIIKRGQIRNEDECYAVRIRIEDLEGNEEHSAELQTMYALVGKYEAQ